MEFNATFIVTAISFVLFSIIMNAIFYKPLQKVVDERQNFIEDTNKDAKIKNKKADAIVKDKELKIEKTKQDAKKIITGKAEEVNAHKAELASSAQKKAAEDIEVAKNSLNQSVNDAQVGLDIAVEDLATEISSKILGKV